MKRYVQEIANDVLRLIDGECNDPANAAQRESAQETTRKKVDSILFYCKRGMISDFEAVRELLKQEE